ncbi:AAC(3) family N-acetyltransferase [Salmonella enterica subsp. enterica serovar Infantis]|nr:AAC(3) family N-acetyltransferase [Salmonella enterica subsp. enterica serovar Infantis]
MPTEQELISRTPQPATRASLARQMRENGLTLGGTVLVHSSLSSLGWVAGGPVAVIQALLDCVGPQGTIVMPTHSGDLTDPADWRSPPVPADWVQILRNEMPAYDPQTTPTRNMGAVAELFRACRKHFWRQLSPSQGRYFGTVAKLAMRQPFVLFKGLTFQKLCLPGAFRPGDHHNKMLRPGLCVVHASPQYL